jgi:hypothetical protein
VDGHLAQRVCVRIRVFPVRLWELLHRGAGHLRELYYRDRRARLRRDAAESAKVVRRALRLGLARRLGGLTVRQQGDRAGWLRPDAFPESRDVAPDRTSRGAELMADNVALMTERQQGVVRRPSKGVAERRVGVPCSTDPLASKSESSRTRP